MQLKTLIRFPVDLRRARRLLAEKASSAEPLAGRAIALDLRSPDLLFDCGRHLATIAHYARTVGSPCYVRCNTLLLSAIARKHHGREMLSEPNVRWVAVDKSLPSGVLQLCDYPSDYPSDRIRMLIGRDIDRDVPVMPYPMHPGTLRRLQHTPLATLRGTARRGGIFFAGNQKPKYGDAKMHRNFGVLSRLDILGTLADRFPTRVTALGDAGSTQQAWAGDAIVISDSRFEPIEPNQWLPMLAKAQFFIGCPGASQPMCHNIIESMSVGTIPILEYGDRFTPQLVDGKNAICFRGRRGLTEAITRIDRLSPQQISQLQRNVTDYYDQHLCGVKFLADLRDGRLDLSSRSVCMPFHERNFYKSPRPVAA